MKLATINRVLERVGLKLVVAVPTAPQDETSLHLWSRRRWEKQVAATRATMPLPGCGGCEHWSAVTPQVGRCNARQKFTNFDTYCMDFKFKPARPS